MQKLSFCFSGFILASIFLNNHAYANESSSSLGQIVPSLEKEREIETLRNNRNQSQMTILPSSKGIFPKSSLFTRENKIFNGEGFFAGKSYKKESLNNPYPTSIETGGMKNMFPQKKRDFKLPKELVGE